MRIIERILVMQRSHPVYGLAKLHAVTASDEGTAGTAYPLSILRVHAPPAYSDEKVPFTAEERVVTISTEDIDALALEVKRTFNGRSFACPLGVIHASWCVGITVSPYQRSLEQGGNLQPGAFVQAILSWTGWASWGRELGA